MIKRLYSLVAPLLITALFAVGCAFDRNDTIPSEESKFKETPIVREVQEAIDYELDSDNDGMSDWFEINIAGLDPKVPNDRYALLLVAGDRDLSLSPSDWYKFLVEKEDFQPKNIIKLEGRYATQPNLQTGINKIAQISDENDFVYILLNAHGNKGRIYLNDGYLPYKTLDEYLDKIRAKAMFVGIEACYSGSAIEDLKEGLYPRVIITSTGPDTLSELNLISLELFGRIRRGYGDDYGVDFPNIDGDGYCSVAEGFDYIKKVYQGLENPTHSNDPKEKEKYGVIASPPQYYDPHNIGSKLFFGDYRVSITQQILGYLEEKLKNLKENLQISE